MGRLAKKVDDVHLTVDEVRATIAAVPIAERCDEKCKTWFISNDDPPAIVRCDECWNDRAVELADYDIELLPEAQAELLISEWIALCCVGNTLFRSDHCGYWLRGVEFDDSNEQRGWLVWEDDEKCAHGDEPDRELALAAWQNGRALPAHWFRLDEAMARKAYESGGKRWGESWYDDPNTDASRYDVAIQLAMLGEVRYG